MVKSAPVLFLGKSFLEPSALLLHLSCLPPGLLYDDAGPPSVIICWASSSLHWPSYWELSVWCSLRTPPPYYVVTALSEVHETWGPSCHPPLWPQDPIQLELYPHPGCPCYVPSTVPSTMKRWGSQEHDEVTAAHLQLRNQAHWKQIESQLPWPWARRAKSRAEAHTGRWLQKTHCPPLRQTAHTAEKLVLTQEKGNWPQPADKPGAVVVYDTQMFKLLPPEWTDEFQKGVKKGAFGYININHSRTWLFTRITEPMNFLFSTPPLPDFSPHSFLLLHDDSAITIQGKKGDQRFIIKNLLKFHNSQGQRLRIQSPGCF